MALGFGLVMSECVCMQCVRYDLFVTFKSAFPVHCLGYLMCVIFIVFALWIGMCVRCVVAVVVVLSSLSSSIYLCFSFSHGKEFSLYILDAVFLSSFKLHASTYKNEFILVCECFCCTEPQYKRWCLMACAHSFCVTLVHVFLVFFSSNFCSPPFRTT